ncbi:MAG: helix-turn-helix transcriptional regulator [Planctomycetes bacterium]|nr:helix-turn-helix transcriptional regulator [Planctomycetota bacterium]MDA0947275.1 helix-turn-helix transcriptional regulator [Planctomycetota bacterium]
MTKAFPPELVRGCAELVLLTLLLSRPMYGYEILTTLEERGNGGFQFKQGTLYPLLYRLEREGWIEAAWVEPEGAKRRKTYRITRDGRRAQRTKAAEWARLQAAVQALLVEAGDA